MSLPELVRANRRKASLTSLKSIGRSVTPGLVKSELSVIAQPPSEGEHLNFPENAKAIDETNKQSKQIKLSTDLESPSSNSECSQELVLNGETNSVLTSNKSIPDSSKARSMKLSPSKEPMNLARSLNLDTLRQDLNLTKNDSSDTEKVSRSKVKPTEEYNDKFGESTSGQYKRHSKSDKSHKPSDQSPNKNSSLSSGQEALIENASERACLKTKEKATSINLSKPQSKDFSQPSSVTEKGPPSLLTSSNEPRNANDSVCAKTEETLKKAKSVDLDKQEGKSDNCRNEESFESDKPSSDSTKEEIEEKKIRRSLKSASDIMKKLKRDKSAKSIKVTLKKDQTGESNCKAIVDDVTKIADSNEDKTRVNEIEISGGINDSNGEIKEQNKQSEKQTKIKEKQDCTDTESKTESNTDMRMPSHLLGLPLDESKETKEFDLSSTLSTGQKGACKSVCSKEEEESGSKVTSANSDKPSSPKDNCNNAGASMKKGQTRGSDCKFVVNDATKPFKIVDSKSTDDVNEEKTRISDIQSSGCINDSNGEMNKSSNNANQSESPKLTEHTDKLKKGKVSGDGSAPVQFITRSLFVDNTESSQPPNSSEKDLPSLSTSSSLQEEASKSVCSKEEENSGSKKVSSANSDKSTKDDCNNVGASLKKDQTDGRDFVVDDTTESCKIMDYSDESDIPKFTEHQNDDKKVKVSDDGSIAVGSHAGNSNVDPKNVRDKSSYLQPQDSAVLALPDSLQDLAIESTKPSASVAKSTELSQPVTEKEAIKIEESICAKPSSDCRQEEVNSSTGEGNSAIDTCSTNITTTDMVTKTKLELSSSTFEDTSDKINKPMNVITDEMDDSRVAHSSNSASITANQSESTKLTDSEPTDQLRKVPRAPVSLLTDSSIANKNTEFSQPSNFTEKDSSSMSSSLCGQENASESVCAKTEENLKKARNVDLDKLGGKSDNCPNEENFASDKTSLDSTKGESVEKKIRRSLKSTSDIMKKPKRAKSVKSIKVTLKKDQPGENNCKTIVKDATKPSKVADSKSTNENVCSKSEETSKKAKNADLDKLGYKSDNDPNESVSLKKDQSEGSDTKFVVNEATKPFKFADYKSTDDVNEEKTRISDIESSGCINDSNGEFKESSNSANITANQSESLKLTESEHTDQLKKAKVSGDGSAHVSSRTDKNTEFYQASSVTEKEPVIIEKIISANPQSDIQLGEANSITAPNNTEDLDKQKKELESKNIVKTSRDVELNQELLLDTSGSSESAPVLTELSSLTTTDNIKLSEEQSNTKTQIEPKYCLDCGSKVSSEPSLSSTFEGTAVVDKMDKPGTSKEVPILKSKVESPNQNVKEGTNKVIPCKNSFSANVTKKEKSKSVRSIKSGKSTLASNKFTKALSIAKKSKSASKSSRKKRPKSAKSVKSIKVSSDLASDKTSTESTSDKSVSRRIRRSAKSTSNKKRPKSAKSVKSIKVSSDLTSDKTSRDSTRDKSISKRLVPRSLKSTSSKKRPKSVKSSSTKVASLGTSPKSLIKESSSKSNKGGKGDDNYDKSEPKDYSDKKKKKPTSLTSQSSLSSISSNKTTSSDEINARRKQKKKERRVQEEKEELKRKINDNSEKETLIESIKDAKSDAKSDSDKNDDELDGGGKKKPTSVSSQSSLSSINSIKMTSSEEQNARRKRKRKARLAEEEQEELKRKKANEEKAKRQQEKSKSSKQK